MSETWRWIPGYVGSYKISTEGRILSVLNKGKLISPATHKSGQLKVNLRKDGRTNTHFVARLVLTTFKGLENGCLAKHIDDDLTNNHLDNLKWELKKKTDG